MKKNKFVSRLVYIGNKIRQGQPGQITDQVS